MGFGFLGARNSDEEKMALTHERQVRIDEAKRKVKNFSRQKTREAAIGARRTVSGFDKGSGQVGGQVARFGKVALAQQADFTPEQEALSSMFGGGEKTWGTNREPVRINNDLHPSLSNSQDETASMFGFGGRI